MPPSMAGLVPRPCPTDRRLIAECKVGGPYLLSLPCVPNLRGSFKAHSAGRGGADDQCAGRGTRPAAVFARNAHLRQVSFLDHALHPPTLPYKEAVVISLRATTGKLQQPILVARDRITDGTSLCKLATLAHATLDGRSRTSTMPYGCLPAERCATPGSTTARAALIGAPEDHRLPHVQAT